MTRHVGVPRVGVDEVGAFAVRGDRDVDPEGLQRGIRVAGAAVDSRGIFLRKYVNAHTADPSADRAAVGALTDRRKIRRQMAHRPACPDQAGTGTLHA